MSRVPQDMKKIVRGLIRKNDKFSVETARALVQSAGLGKAHSNRQRTQPRNRKGLDNSRAIRSSGFSGNVISSTSKPPTSVGYTSRPRVGLPDMRGLRLRYFGGDIVNGTATQGLLGDLYVRPGTSTAFYSGGWIPIQPADLTNINGVSGFGQLYINDVFRHYSRVRYNRIALEFIPYGLSMNTSSLTTIAMAPLRGPLVGTHSNATSSTSAYPVFTTGTFTAAEVVSNVASFQGGLQFPSWEAARIDMTPYIAGGSGPKQNEFAMYSFSNFVAPLNIPCCWRLTGDTPASQTTQSFYGTVYIDLDVDLLDFCPFQNGQIQAVGASIVKEATDEKSRDRDFKAPLPKLDFRAAVLRRDEPQSPTQSLLGAALDSTHLSDPPARTRSSAMAIPIVKRGS